MEVVIFLLVMFFVLRKVVVNDRKAKQQAERQQPHQPGYPPGSASPQRPLSQGQPFDPGQPHPQRPYTQAARPNQPLAPSGSYSQPQGQRPASPSFGADDTPPWKRAIPERLASELFSEVPRPGVPPAGARPYQPAYGSLADSEIPGELNAPNRPAAHPASPQMRKANLARRPSGVASTGAKAALSAELPGQKKAAAAPVKMQSATAVDAAAPLHRETAMPECPLSLGSQDWRQALILAEILAPPKAKRSPGERPI